ncbi:MAG TPA: hypothetical protein VFH59_04190 [Frateuria sp.]|nr:hypothetical protein [Frateuria sp.]HET6804626.1 hypothetical protein [Frateuria sp.]
MVALARPLLGLARLRRAFDRLPALEALCAEVRAVTTALGFDFA